MAVKTAPRVIPNGPARFFTFDQIEVLRSFSFILLSDQRHDADSETAGLRHVHGNEFDAGLLELHPVLTGHRL